MFAGTYSCYDRYDVGNTCGSFFMAQNITSLSYSDQQASICEEYANLSFNNPSKINIENFKILFNTQQDEYNQMF